MLINPTKKSLSEILKSDIGINTLRDLMTLDVVHPFATEEDRDRDEKVLFESVTEELEDRGRHILEILTEKGFLDETEWEDLIGEMASTKTPLSTLLVNHRIVEPNMLGELADELKSAIEEHDVQGKSLKDILIKEKLLDDSGYTQVLQSAREEGLRFAQAIVAKGLIPYEKLAKVFKDHFDIESVDVSDLQIEFQVVNLVPDNLMKTHEVLPIRKKGKKLHLAMTDPRCRSVIRKLEMMTRMEVVPFYTDRRALLKRLEEFIVVPEASQDRIKAIAGDEDTFRALLDSDSAVKMVNRIIEGALNTKATDIHIEPQEKGLRIRYRIDGMLYDIMNIPRDMGIPTVSRFKVLSGMDVTERRRAQDGHVSYDYEGSRYNMRAATLPTNLGEKVVLRLLDETAVIKGLPNLGFSKSELEVFKQMIHRPYGMVLVTGPIGSGKTTTLYAAISEINHQSQNIVTLEDPVEYEIPGVNQVQIDLKIGLTFASGLRSVLRQDANTLMVGEIRDSETAETAVRAANTGHLLFSTLHTNYALSALTALQHLGVPTFQIATALQGVVAQRLVRVLCPECKKQVKPKKLVQDLLRLTPKDKIYIPQGCPACFETGYVGRIAIFEILNITDRVKEAIIEGLSEKELVTIASEEGMVTLQESGRQKVLDGVTGFDELSRVVVLKKD